jgi:2-iminobutanoate/2-iminopropanoate deaminase
MAMAQVAPGGQLLVCAGQVGRRPDGTFPAGAAEQCRLAFAACADILEAAGLGWSDVVLRTAWLTAGCDAADYAAVVATVAGDGVPASVAVGVEMPGEVMVEVEVIAAKVGAASPARSVLKWDPPGVTPSSAYWHAATVPGDARLLFASGQIGVRPDGSIADSAPEQAELTYSNLDTLLRDAGMGWADVVKRTTFRVPGWNREQHEMPAVEAAMGDEKSCHTGVGVRCLAAPELQLEVDIVAAAPVGEGSDGSAVVRKWNPPGLAAPMRDGYVHCAEVPPNARLLISSGLVGRRPDGSLPANGAEQSLQLFANLTSLLRGAGMGWEDAVKIMVYMAPGCELAGFRAARDAAQSGQRCTSTLIGVRALLEPGALLEIEIVAAKADASAL